MNYGRENLSKKKKDMTGSKVGKKVGLTVVKAVLICLLVLIVAGGCAGYGIVKGLIDSAPDISNMNVAPTASATYIYDQTGKPIQKLTEPTSNRTLVKITDIPLDLQHAVVAIEDERFYQHNGIDVKGIIRAGIIGVTSGHFSEGASTITQQLLKNNVFTDWVTETNLIEKFKRKFQEQYLAIKLEEVMTKEQILEDYLNTINLGAGAYGVQAAAHRYFNKDVSELTLSESTVLAGISQNPTAYDPILYPTNNADRRETVLKKMVEQEYITQEQMDEALADDVYSRIQKTDSETEQTSVYTYYVDALIDQVMDDLQTELGYSYLQAYKALYSGGLKVYSAQDDTIQQICDEEFANPANYPSFVQTGLDYALSIQQKDGEVMSYGTSDLLAYFQANGEPDFNLLFDDDDTARSYAEQYKQSVLKTGDTVLTERVSLIPQPQASVVIMDQSTGFVKAIVGGRGKKEASLTLNRATSTRRQPGSTFKIVSTYAPAIDSAGMTLATVFDDEPYAYTTGVEVKNWDSYNQYKGMTTIRDAITNSVNVVAVKCLTQITPRLGFDYAEKFGISTLYDDVNLDVRQPLALGGVTDGVVNKELTAAFAAIANKGQYNKPKFYTKIEDVNGNTLIDNSPVSTTVIKDSTAFLLTSAMQDVVTRGTASGINLGEMAVAGKTGTTDDYRNIWFVGYTPYYTCGIWGGYDNNDELPEGDIYHTYSKVLWNSIMTRIHAELPAMQFEAPANIVKTTVCRKSGKLAIPGVCSNDPRGSQVYEEYFVSGTEPTESCDLHVAVSVCSKTGLLATSTCPSFNKICIKRPAGSEGTTEDSNYAPPYQTCPGHTVIEQIDDLLNGDKEKESESETENPQESEAPPDQNGGQNTGGEVENGQNGEGGQNGENGGTAPENGGGDPGQGQDVPQQ